MCAWIATCSLSVPSVVVAVKYIVTNCNLI